MTDTGSDDTSDHGASGSDRVDTPEGPSGEPSVASSTDSRPGSSPTSVDAASTVTAPGAAAETPISPPVSDPSTVLGRIPTGTTLRAELAAAARSRGMRSRFVSELAMLHESIESIDVPRVELENARKRVAETSGEEERLKERVAAIRGDVRARRAVEADTEESLAKLEEAAAALSAAQTDRIAAEQALERARERAATARDERERRLSLRDRLENRRRDARSALANATYPAFRRALSAVPKGGEATPGGDPSAYDGSSLAASFAAVRIAAIDGPVLLDGDAAVAFDRWDGPSAETVLGVPVVRPDL